MCFERQYLYLKSYFQLKPFYFALPPSSTPSFHVLWTEALKTTWMEKLSCLHIKTNIISGFQVVLMDIVCQVISVSLFKIHKTKCTLRDSKIYQIIYISVLSEILERSKHSTCKEMTSALLPLSFSFFIRLGITSERK